MTLTSHAISGAAAASFFPKDPVPAFIFGFLSHFVLDIIPHGHYPLRSHTRHPENRLAEDMLWGKAFLADLAKIAADFAAGLALAYFLLANASFSPIVFLGALAGIFPDALQFVYWKIRKEPLTSLQKFHLWMHAEKNFDSKPVIGTAIEFGIIAVSVLLVRFFA